VSDRLSDWFVAGFPGVETCAEEATAISRIIEQAVSPFVRREETFIDAILTHPREALGISAQRLIASYRWESLS
jgi:hypothetical protein